MNEKLFDIIKYAYNNSDFYKEKLRPIFEKNIDEISLEEFKTVDCVSRLDLINNVSDILSYDYKYLNRKDLITERTSGSTGENVTVYWKHSDWIKSNYYLWEKGMNGMASSLRIKCVLFTPEQTSDARRCILTIEG